MIRTHLFFLMSLLILLTCSGTPIHLEGKYQIVGYSSFPISAMDDAESKSYVGKTITFSQSKIYSESDTCNSVSYVIDSIDVLDHFGDLQKEITAKIKKSLPKTLKSITIECSKTEWNGILWYYLFVDKSTLLAERDGVVFYLTKKE